MGWSWGSSLLTRWDKHDYVADWEKPLEGRANWKSLINYLLRLMPFSSWCWVSILPQAGAQEICGYFTRIQWFCQVLDCFHFSLSSFKLSNCHIHRYWSSINIIPISTYRKIMPYSPYVQNWVLMLLEFSYICLRTPGT